MKTKLFISLFFILPLFLAGCWAGTCDEEVTCDYCDTTGCYDTECMPVGCITDDQCNYMEYCNQHWGQCYPEDIQCIYDWECPEGSVCDFDSETGYNYCTNPNQSNACLTDWDCPESSYCNEFTGACEESIECTVSADCDDGYYCDSRNVCSPSPIGDCTNDAQCGQGAYCDNGTCMDSTLCEVDEDCTDPLAPICDERGSCIADDNPPVACLNSTDCETGNVCVDGFCENETPRDPSLNCLINEHCGENGICLDGKCYGACIDSSDCGTGQICGTNGQCEEDPASGTECVNNTNCSDTSDVCLDGTCHEFCTDNDDCTNSHDRCDEGVCVANDVVTPECYTNNGCTGGEECFQGVCRVPCEDEVDCIACPGNPICGLGGYCMDENDVNPECTLSEDCTDSKVCVDAMCI
jgi:Dickkopf N-terminal cysteine-rich region